VHIPVLKLLRSEPLGTLLYEIITPYGFTPSQVEAVRELLGSPSGRYVLSATHRILKDRNWLIISALGPAEGLEHILLESSSSAVDFEQGRLCWRVEGLPSLLDQGPRVALVDADKVRFPLLLRRWRAGDYFYPLGMRKKKKLSRFFIDSKLSVADKEKVWVLEMDKKIVWVVGQRIDDRFRIGPGTRQVLRIEL
jgi:tRNA(Ile)-lysidine synthase